MERHNKSIAMRHRCHHGGSETHTFRSPLWQVWLPCQVQERLKLSVEAKSETALGLATAGASYCALRLLAEVQQRHNTRAHEGSHGSSQHVFRISTISQAINVLALNFKN